MEDKKANLLRSFKQIRELFEDAKKLENVVETITSDSDIETLSLTGNVIIDSLVTRLNDVDHKLKNQYSGRMKKKREKLLKKNQRKLEKEKERILENDEGGSSDDSKTAENSVDKNVEHNSSKGSVENENLNYKKRSSDEDAAKSSRNKKLSKKNDESNRKSSRKLVDSDSELENEKIVPKKKSKKSEKTSRKAARKSRKLDNNNLTESDENVSEDSKKSAEKKASKKAEKKARKSKKLVNNDLTESDDNVSEDSRKSVEKKTSKKARKSKKLVNNNLSDCDDSLSEDCRKSEGDKEVSRKGKNSSKRSLRNKASSESVDKSSKDSEDTVKEKETANVNESIVEESSKENVTDANLEVDQGGASVIDKTADITENREGNDQDLTNTCKDANTENAESEKATENREVDEDNLSNTSLDSVATILTAETSDKNKESDEISGRLIVTAEDKEAAKDKSAAQVSKESAAKSDFPMSVETLEGIVTTFLNCQSNENNNDESGEIEQMDESVMLIENDVSLVVVDDDDDLVPRKSSNDLVGKIKLVDIGKLTTKSMGNEVELPKIKIADFARLLNSPAKKIEVNEKKQKKINSKDSDESESNGRIRNPFAKRLDSELEKLIGNKDKILGKDAKKSKKGNEDEDSKLKTDESRRVRNPFVKNKLAELEKLKEQRLRRLEREQLQLKQERHDAKQARKKERREKEKARREKQKAREVKRARKKAAKFVIPNNKPITVVAKAILDESTAEPTDKVSYCVAHPEELSDAKLLLRCFVRMPVRCTPEQLLQEYKDRTKEDVEVLDVRMESDDDGDDSESDSSTMVSKRTLRSNANSKSTSNASSRNSSVSSKVRTTRNSNPIVDRPVNKGGNEDEDESDKVSSDDEVLAKKRNGSNKAPEKEIGKGKEKSRGRRLRNKDDKKKNGKGKRRGKDESSDGGDDEEDDEDSDDAMSHVSISSTSEPEIKKSSKNKNKLKSSKHSKSSRKNSDNSEEESDSDDSLPLTKLPDRKVKKEELGDSDSEPVKKKDKKTKKKSESESESDSDDSRRNRKRKLNKRGLKKKRLVSDSGSDFDQEDSDDDDIESVKSSASEEKAVVNKPMRKRIKRNKDDSSDDSDGGKSKRGKKKKGEPIDTRKHIRHILGKKALNQSTIDAEQEESDRKKRILERQKRYNDIYNPKDLESDKMDKVVLDIDEDTNEEILSVDRSIVKHLKPHQAKGIQFMWNACYESVSMIDERGQKGSGCILAHCMGLGKTLQVIALIHTLITNSDTTKTEKALVVCPLSTVLNWVAEFHKWLKDDIDFEIYEIVSCKQVSERQYKIADWHKHGGVMIMGYDMFRNLSNPDNKRVNKNTRKTFVTGLVDPGPDLVICDEGHLLKNEKTSISIAMNRIRTLRRIVLTGTPLQNNLKEYFCMVQFVKPNLLGTYKEYLNRFVNPITNGQYTDSTPHDIQIMRRRSHVLHKLLDGIVQRRDYAVLAPYLPPKHEYVIFVTLTDQQIALYDHYLRVIAPQQRTQATKGVSLFKDFQEFQRICTHPRVLLDKSVQDQMAKWKEEEEADTDGTEGSIKDFIDDDEEEAESTCSETSKSSFDSKQSDDGAPRRGRSKPKPVVARTTRAVAAEKGIDVVATTSTLEVANTGSEWWREFISDENLKDLLCSSKLALLFEILHQCELIGDKVLIFSQSLYSLSVIEYFLAKIDDACQTGDSNGVGGYAGSWSLGLDYFRLDGSSSCDNRAAWCKTFNNPKNTRARLFLISTRAGGLGINLVAANRVIIFDVSWNPSHDIQSIYRVYRFGQIKPSFVYRFVTNGTMEMKVYERQVTKQAISKRVIDEQQIDRHYNQNDLAELYKFEPKPEHRPIPPVPKDVLLGELVHDKADLIYKYHEHHTLLENKQEEELNEEERKAAWDEFENEKKMRQMPAHINNIPIHSIILGLTNYLKREHPEWSAADVQTAVPSLVQEMQEKMLLGDVALYNAMIIELRSLQQQQQQLQQQRMQDYYRLQQQSQERMLLERHRQLMTSNATVSYLQRLYASATTGNMTQAALSGALNALNNPLGRAQLNPNQPQIIETVDIND